MKELLIVRGLPGSGKSTIAKQIQDTFGGVIVCADDFWGPAYAFDKSRIQEAHDWAYRQCEAHMQWNEERIILDGTYAQLKWMARYVEMATHFGYRAICREPDTEWAWNPRQCAEKNVHGVSEDVINTMLSKWENPALNENWAALARLLG